MLMTRKVMSTVFLGMPGQRQIRQAALPEPIQEAIEECLSKRHGTAVRIAAARNFPHSSVWRCHLARRSDDSLPASVVVRLPRIGSVRSHPARLAVECAALDFLDAIGSTVAPRAIAVGKAAGFLVTQDLGTGPSVLDLLLGNDPAAAAACLAFAGALGEMHAQTRGLEATFAEFLERSGSQDLAVDLDGSITAVSENWQHVRQAVAVLHLPAPSPAADDEIAGILDRLSVPSGEMTLSSGDPTFVNTLLIDGQPRFVDFEEAAFRHPLLDAVVLRFPYPTGGPPWRLPREIAEAMERAYRDAYGANRFDDAGYEQTMVAVLLTWTVLRLVRLPRVDAGPDCDPWLLLPPSWNGPPPVRSRRRQLMAIIETCLASAQPDAACTAITSWLERLAVALQRRWPEAGEPDPPYPAFAGDAAPLSTFR